jgi:quinol monooxygenase YgiN
MLMIAGFIRLDPAHKDAFVDAQVDLVRRARQTRGCLDLAITADCLEPVIR